MPAVVAKDMNTSYGVNMYHSIQYSSLRCSNRAVRVMTLKCVEASAGRLHCANDWDAVGLDTGKG